MSWEIPFNDPQECNDPMGFPLDTIIPWNTGIPMNVSWDATIPRDTNIPGASPRDIQYGYAMEYLIEIPNRTRRITHAIEYLIRLRVSYGSWVLVEHLMGSCDRIYRDTE